MQVVTTVGLDIAKSVPATSFFRVVHRRYRADRRDDVLAKGQVAATAARS